jgi:outer membrane protein assembly factor BamB
VSSSLDNKTYALDTQTGAFIWSFQAGSSIYSSPAVTNGVAYFGSYDHNLYALGQAAGTSGSSGGSQQGLPSIFYYALVIVVLVVVIAVAIVVIRKRR